MRCTMPAVLLVLLRAAGWAKRVAPTVDRGHSCRRPPPPPPPPAVRRVIHEGADPVQVQTENMSRPLKAEVDARVAMAAHHAEVPAPPPAPPSQVGRGSDDSAQEHTCSIS